MPRKACLALSLLVLVAAAAPAAAAGDGRLEPGWQADAALQGRLDGAVKTLGLEPLVADGKLTIALVDLSGKGAPRRAHVRGYQMMYAASVPKIAVLYAAFAAQRAGRLAIDAPFRKTLTDMVRVSSNTAASKAIHKVGFDYIEQTLRRSGLYDAGEGGGLWVGKTYGGKNDFWRRDPVAQKSHGATALSIARLLTVLGEGKLIDAQASGEMKQILGDPGLHHKFVKGLDARPGSHIYRKSGSWRQWHGDAALVERGGKRYVAVALCEDPAGGGILERLIVALDDCI